MQRTKEFLETLFQGTRGYIELRTITNKGEVSQFFYPAKDIDRLISNLTNDYEGTFKDTNVYFGACPRNERKGKEGNIKEVNCFWADLDCNDQEERKERLEKLKKFKLSPSIVVCSGNGLHCYWLLKKPYLIKNNEDKLTAKGYLKGLAIALNGDKTFDLSRILRVPGTKNVKDPKNPLLVEVLEFNPAIRYTPSIFEEYKVKIEETTIPDIDTSMDNIPDRFWRVLEENTKLRTTWEGKRKNLKDDTRSGYDMSLATLLMPYDFSDSEVASILRASPSGKGKEAKPQYLNITIGKAKAEWEKRKKESLERQKEKSSKQKFNPRSYSEEILKENSLMFDRYKRFWIYDKEINIWRMDAELVLNSILRQRILGTDDYKRYCVNEIVADLQGLTFIREEPQEPGPHLIPFKNKIYDLKNNILLDYSADFFFINKLAVDIDAKNKECPTIDKIFKEIVDSDDIDTLYEIPSYCLYRAYPYPKIFILYGSGGNGKTAYLKVINKVLGRDNVSLVASNELQYNRFASSELFGKMLNVSGEMDYTILKNTSKLKQCSGEDLVYCEKKFKEPFSFVNYAKMIFLTNQVPMTWDKTYAFYRRVFLLEFPYKFILGETADPMITDKISPGEYKGLAWKCLQILKRLYDNDFVFSKHEKTEEVIRKYEDLSNPLNKFLEEFTEPEPNSDIAVPDFNEQYISYLKNKGFRVWNNREINQAMRDKGFKQKPLGGSGGIPTYRAWIELKWK